MELPVLTNQEAADILVSFLYLGKPGAAQSLSSIDNFATAEQLYLLGDALGIDPLRRMVGARIEMPDLAQWAVASQLKYHEHFAADHLDNVVDVVRCIQCLATASCHCLSTQWTGHVPYIRCRALDWP